MSKLSLIGILSLVGGFFMFVFQKVSVLMGRTDLMAINTLNDMVGKEWVAKLPSFLRSTGHYIGDSPVTLLLCVIGGIFIVIGGLRKNV